MRACMPIREHRDTIALLARAAPGMPHDAGHHHDEAPKAPCPTHSLAPKL